ncbi:glycosyltransferase [Pedobacter aquae]|uniref:Glycosyltransferase n=1 Tax=Pedobacter aquae TaxID=2605747 RepID=A0A5C0VMJ3_9SPHI|nr:glycosyltransferase [Pedobacter aquae]QEK52214.1 glycosyltransferase [Pedobacter aquae]
MKKKIKEISVFTFGDSTLVRTWSNVPYMLTKTLEKQGYKINRININPNRYLQSFYNRVIYKLTLLLKNDNVYLYERTYINYILTFIKIWRYNKKYPNADLNIFTNFSFYNKYSARPNILLCDWDLSIGINDRLGRKPYYFEQQAIRRQMRVIEHADLVISLFPKSADIMKKMYKNPNIFHLNQNVINSLYEKELDEAAILKIKEKSFDLLFIGSTNYIAGAKLLITAYVNLKIDYPMLKVKIIGIRGEELGELPDGVEAFGYLDKNLENDNRRYYDLLINAKVFVNPTPVWGGYSSTIEAMYFYTPIIIAPYEEFTTEFGEEISFGRYCNEFEVLHLQHLLEDEINSPNYRNHCLNAQEKVKNYTWDNYVKLLLEKFSDVTSN